jgi:hypothetical protein
MTVAELIAKLANLDPDLTVVFDGFEGPLKIDDAYEGVIEDGVRWAILDGDKIPS